MLKVSNLIIILHYLNLNNNYKFENKKYNKKKQIKNKKNFLN